MLLCDSMTVADNIALGKEAGLAGGNPLRQVYASRSERSAVRQAVSTAIERCGIAGISGRQCGSLSTGQRRLVELARVIAGGFSVILLDEPSSGLDSSETARFGDILQSLHAQGDIAILLVEHDISLVRSVCAYCYVLDFGELICEGKTEEVLASDVVRDAYLGSEEAS
jgi:ABC-type branched-subunit amino acid transport system ATPase component